jgi:hypothetical protein
MKRIKKFFSVPSLCSKFLSSCFSDKVFRTFGETQALPAWIQSVPRRGSGWVAAESGSMMTNGPTRYREVVLTVSKQVAPEFRRMREKLCQKNKKFRTCYTEENPNQARYSFRGGRCNLALYL